MKIKTKKYGSQQASIHKDKNGKVIVRIAEIETGISDRNELEKLIEAGGDPLEGVLEKATEKELSLLKEQGGDQIEIRDDFICWDSYQDKTATEQQVTWNTRNDRVTANTDTNEHLLDGEVITIEELLRRHNLSLL